MYSNTIKLESQKHVLEENWARDANHIEWFIAIPSQREITLTESQTAEITSTDSRNNINRQQKH